MQLFLPRIDDRLWQASALAPDVGWPVIQAVGWPIANKYRHDRATVADLLVRGTGLDRVEEWTPLGNRG